MFDPENVIYYNAPWTPQRSPDRERHQQWVQAQDYDQLLELYKAEVNSKPIVRVVAFRDHLVIFGKDYHFGVKVPDVPQETIDSLLAHGRPENGQDGSVGTNHKGDGRATEVRDNVD